MAQYLTARQRRFAEEYMISLDAKQAAIRAGYSARTAAEQGCQLLKHPRIAAHIEQETDARAERIRVDTDRVVAELAAIGFANIFDYIECGGDGEIDIKLGELTRAQAAAIQELRIDDRPDRRGPRVWIKLAPKEPALTRLANHLGAFSEAKRKELTFHQWLAGITHPDVYDEEERRAGREPMTRVKRSDAPAGGGD